MDRYSNLSLEIDKYLLDKTYPYAIMIDGAWGSGKTFFIKKYMEKSQKENSKHYIYISLYGVTDISDINKQIRLQYYLGRNRVKQKYELTKLGTSIVFDILENKGIKEKYIRQYLNFIKKDSVKGCDIVLILDDFERSTVPILDILGHVNGLVEHQRYKVIILANEKEIGKEMSNLELKYLVAKDNNIVKEDETSHLLNLVSNNHEKETNQITIAELKNKVSELFFEKSRYDLVKEKVIGVTYIYEPDIKTVISEILSDIISYYEKDNSYNFYQSIFELIKNYEDKVSYIMEQQKYKNLRTYQFFLSKILNLYGSLKKSAKSRSEDIEKLIEQCYISIFKECILFKLDKSKQSNLDLLKDFLSDYIRGENRSSDNQFVEKIWKYYDMVSSNNEIDMAVKAIYDWSNLNRNDVEKEFLCLKRNITKIDFILYKRILNSLVYIEEYKIIESKEIESFLLLLSENISEKGISEAFIEDLQFNHFEKKLEANIYKSYLSLLLENKSAQVKNPFEEYCNNKINSLDMSTNFRIFDVNYLSRTTVDNMMKKLKAAKNGAEVKKVYFLLYDVYISNYSAWREKGKLQENIESLKYLKDEINKYSCSDNEIDPVIKYWLNSIIEIIDKISKWSYSDKKTTINL